MLRRRVLPVAAAAGVLLGAAATPAGAEEVHTSQADRIGAQASTWAPPAPRPAAICLIDTGVDAVPDTSANVVARLAVDGGGGGDVSADKHGTLMAMVAAAPLNGWGMVGIAPGQPIVSVRAQRAAGEGFRFDDFRAALVECRREAPRYNVRVANLSLGASGTPAPASVAALADAVDGARARGISVVGAAGNRPGPVEWPAALPSILSVGALGADGALCAFAASGADLLAPGCDLDVVMPLDGIPAWGAGSSEASMIASAALAQLYSHRPDLSPDDAEQLLGDAAREVAAGAALDVATTWSAAGLGELLQAGAAAAPPRPTRPEPVVPQPSGGNTIVKPGVELPVTYVPGSEPIAPPAITRAAWARPRVKRVVYRRGLATITATRAPRGAQLVLQLRGGRGRRAWTRTAHGRGPRLRIRTPLWTRATLRVEGSGRTTSPAANIRPPRTCAPACR